MQFDHIDSNNKIIDVSASIKCDVVKTELTKCQLLCKSCHLKKSTTDGVWRGVNNSHAKLDPDKVKMIRLLILKGESDATISVKFNVSHGTIYSLRVGKTWTHVK